MVSGYSDRSYVADVERDPFCDLSRKYRGAAGHVCNEGGVFLDLWSDSLVNRKGLWACLLPDAAVCPLLWLLLGLCAWQQFLANVQ